MSIYCNLLFLSTLLHRNWTENILGVVKCSFLQRKILWLRMQHWGTICMMYSDIYSTFNGLALLDLCAPHWREVMTCKLQRMILIAWWAYVIDYYENPNERFPIAKIWPSLVLDIWMQNKCFGFTFFHVCSFPYLEDVQQKWAVASFQQNISSSTK